MARLSSSMRHFSYANIMATIAVFVSLGGASYAAIKLPAGSVGTRQIKPRAVTKAKIDPKLINSLRGRPGPTGSTGLTGPSGPQGAAGAPIAVQRVQSQSAYNASGGIKNAVATCPAGTRALGGGGKAEGTGTLGLRTSDLTNDGTGWSVQGYSDGSGAWQVTAEAICG